MPTPTTASTFASLLTLVRESVAKNAVLATDFVGFTPQRFIPLPEAEWKTVGDKVIKHRVEVCDIKDATQLTRTFDVSKPELIEQAMLRAKNRLEELGVSRTLVVTANSEYTGESARRGKSLESEGLVRLTLALSRAV